jgi:hypothetical protein
MLRIFHGSYSATLPRFIHSRRDARCSLLRLPVFRCIAPCCTQLLMFIGQAYSSSWGTRRYMFGKSLSGTSKVTPSLSSSSSKYNHIHNVAENYCNWPISLHTFTSFSGLFLARRSLSSSFQVLQLQYRTIAATQQAKIDRIT